MEKKKRSIYATTFMTYSMVIGHDVQSVFKGFKLFEMNDRTYLYESASDIRKF